MVFRSLSHVIQNLTAVVNPFSEDLRLSIGTRDKKILFSWHYGSPSCHTTWCFCSEQLSRTGKQKAHGNCSEQLFPVQAVSGSIATAFASLSSLLLSSKAVPLFCSSTQIFFCHSYVPKISFYIGYQYIIFNINNFIWIQIMKKRNLQI